MLARVSSSGLTGAVAGLTDAAVAFMVAVGLNVVTVCVMIVFSFDCLLVGVWFGLFVVFETVVGFIVGFGLAVGVGVDVAVCVGAGTEFLLGELLHGMKRYFPTPEVETSGLGDFDESDIDMNPILRNCLRKRMLRLTLHGRLGLLETAPKVPFLVMSYSCFSSILPGCTVS